MVTGGWFFLYERQMIGWSIREFMMDGDPGEHACGNADARD